MKHERILRSAVVKCIENGMTSQPYSIDDYYSLIFSHDFARAFWGKKKIKFSDPLEARASGCTFLWQYHLQQMVLRKNPINYLQKFI